jgi:riboflavin kinase
MQLEGRVFSGSGEGTQFVTLPWVKAQTTEKLGFIPYDGTLNIKLNENSLSLKKRFLNKAKPTYILPTRGFCRGTCFKAVFMGKIECAVVIPEVNDYPEDVIEIIAPTNLREKFQLKDGDIVKVKIFFS